MGFRYRAYTGGPDPLADPDPPRAEERVEATALGRGREGDGDAGEGSGAAPPPVGSRTDGLLAPVDGNGHGLTPRELRRLGRIALRDIERAARSGTGRHAGGGAPGTEPTGASLPRDADDDRPLDPVASVRAATLRRRDPAEREIRLRADDLRVAETEPVGARAVSLLVDLSHSMVERDLHTAAARTALALHTLVGAHHPEDRIHLVGFGETAHELAPGRLTAHEWRRAPGTNLHHALRLARRNARRHRGLRPLVLVVTDGEPTAHVDDDGRARFAWPPDPRTAEVTLAELDRLLREGAEAVFFLLADAPRLRAFAAEVGRRRSVRVVRSDAAALGPLVLDRYLGRRG
ncbi:VWA domain-containing protein [Nocardiopsis sp. NPDC050513]|uniref:VWA domain-containing protein n=1 Tax=Nocardiopsis sp. NPDC050513 TaxID=3364338 RepID=UPI0037B9C27E